MALRAWRRALRIQYLRLAPRQPRGCDAGDVRELRIENELLDGVEGGYTVHHLTGEETTVFKASERYREEGTPLVVLSGEEFGTGSSRDWAAKGTDLLGIQTTIAKSYERIFCDNLIGMGVLPLQFADGEG